MPLEILICFSIKERILIVKTIYQNQSSISVALGKLSVILGRDYVPYAPTIYQLTSEFEEQGNVADRRKPGPERNE